MNYIKQLQEQVSTLQEEKKELEDKIQDLKVYLYSSKFQGDGNNWVSVQDVLNRLGLY